jgi:hypothetical protein
MNTNFYATKDRSGRVNTGCHHKGGEQYRREMRAALHDLQQRLGQRHNGHRSVQLSATAGPAPLTGARIKRSILHMPHGFYTVFTSRALS